MSSIYSLDDSLMSIIREVFWTCMAIHFLLLGGFMTSRKSPACQVTPAHRVRALLTHSCSNKLKPADF